MVVKHNKYLITFSSVVTTDENVIKYLLLLNIYLSKKYIASFVI